MLKDSPKKKVTIDDLAMMVAKGFSEAKVDLVSLENRLSVRIDGVEKKIDNLDKKVDRIDSRLTNQLDYVLLHYTRKREHELLNKRVEKLERRR